MPLIIFLSTELFSNCVVITPMKGTFTRLVFLLTIIPWTALALQSEGIEKLIRAGEVPDSIRVQYLNDKGWKLRLGNNDSAKIYLDSAKALASSKGLINDELKILNRLITVNLDKADLVTCLNLINRSLFLAQKNQNRRELAYSYYNLGRIMLLMEHLHHSSSIILKAKKIFEEIQDQGGQINSFILLAENYLQQGNSLLVLSIAEEILPQLEEIGNIDKIIELLIISSHAHLQSGDFANAEKDLTRAKKFLDDRNVPSFNLKINLLSAKLFAAQGNKKEAIAAFESTSALSQNVRDPFLKLEFLRVYANYLMNTGLLRESIEVSHEAQLLRKTLFEEVELLWLEAYINSLNNLNVEWERGYLLEKTGAKAKELQEARNKLYTLYILTAGLLLSIVLIISNYLKSKEKTLKLTKLNKDLTEKESLLLQQKTILQLKGEEIAEKNLSLEQLLKDKEEILHLAAHDLKTPLANIISLSDVIRMDGEINHEQGVSLNLIKKVAEENIQLIDNLLLAERIEKKLLSKNYRQVNLEDILESILKSMQSTLERKSIVVDKDFSESKGAIFESDAFALRRIFENLIGNAAKFSPLGSQICIRLIEKPFQLEVTIMDEGPGIPAEEQNKLFTKFAKISVSPTGNESGSGLGLFIVKKLVEELRGEIGVFSKVGDGTTFKVILPK